MRILQLISHYVPAYRFGGALNVAHPLAKALIAQGHEVHVCTTSLQDAQHDLAVPLDAPVDVDGVRVYYNPTARFRLARYWGFSAPMARRAWAEMAWADVVLIHFHYQFASLMGSWVARLRRKPYVIFTHGSLNRYGVTARSRARKHLYLKLFERGNFQRALFAAYHSEEERETSFQFGRDRVVSNGIDPRSFETPPPGGYFRQRYPELADRLCFLYLGRLDAGKGLDLLLPAFRNLLDEHPEAHLVLAGGDERGYEARVRELVAELGLSERVTLTGLIGGALKLGALQDADVYVLPSRSEGLSIAMLEAMHMGLPVVVTDRVGLWRQVQARRCGLVAPLDEARLAAALRQMAAAPDRVEMGRRGRELVASHYTWDAIARDLVGQIQGFSRREA